VTRLFLASNSTLHGQGYLDHCAPALVAFLGPARRIVFVPFALADRAGYVAKVRARLAPLGFEVEGLAAEGDPRPALARAEAVFVGGGNTFRLLATLQRLGALGPLCERVRAGMPYVGSSAGSNLACPTIRTTNDMPIVEPRGFEALGLVPFQINPHYQDPDPGSRHMGETREQRIAEYLEENERPVLGLREGAWLRREGARLELAGTTGARLFRRGRAPEELAPPARLDGLLEAPRGS
jgi:dipeptidase E